MTFNWDNIKYLFQVPLGWFKAVHDYLFGAYGTNFIVVKQDQDGAMQIDVDQAAFAQAVSNIAGDGTVKSVDGIYPDLSGNVQLSGYVKSVNGVPPDTNGEVSVDVGVVTIDSTAPDADGNIDLSYVKTVNNTAPDADGNVDVTVDKSNCILTSDWMSTTRTYNVSPYVYANLVYNGNLPAGVTNLYSWVGALTYQTLDDCIYDLGYLKDDDLGDLAYMDSVTVDGHASDANGEVSFGLTGSKWVKTDASGHLTTTNDTPIAIDTSHYTPQTTTLTAVTGVTWNGTKLQYTYTQLEFQQGVLVQVGNELTANIDTPVVITWS